MGVSRRDLGGAWMQSGIVQIAADILGLNEGNAADYWIISKKRRRL